MALPTSLRKRPRSVTMTSVAHLTSSEMKSPSFTFRMKCSSMPALLPRKLFWKKNMASASFGCRLCSRAASRMRIQLACSSSTPFSLSLESSMSTSRREMPMDRSWAACCHHAWKKIQMKQIITAQNMRLPGLYHQSPLRMFLRLSGASMSTLAQNRTATADSLMSCAKFVKAAPKVLRWLHPHLIRVGSTSRTWQPSLLHTALASSKYMQ
mmetsp:Transcript_33393/g.85316  ORF Transcript_33393/g.85316 Transcript_33393/m.85316 type:complete len:211 (+) Transcript_33393:597-1229(+)